MTGFFCKIIKTQRCQPLEISNLEIFFRTSIPPPRPSSSIRPLPPPPLSNFAGNSIYQGLQVVEYSSNQTLAYIGVTKKKLSSICLQRTTCITQGNEARNRNTSMRSQMISEFWNIRSFVGNWSKLSFIWWFLVTRTREREITSVSERLLDNPGELAYMKT